MQILLLWRGSAFAVSNFPVVVDPAQGFLKLLCSYGNIVALQEKSHCRKKLRRQARKMGSAFKISSESLHMAELIIRHSSALYTECASMCVNTTHG